MMSMQPAFASTTCPNCQTLFERLPVVYDEEAAYVALEVRPCAEPACGAMLCPCCEQFQCDGCGLTFCDSHKVAIPDGTDSPLRCCPTCAAETELTGAETPPAEPVAAAPDEPMCPDCGSSEVASEIFHGAMDP